MCSGMHVVHFVIAFLFWYRIPSPSPRPKIHCSYHCNLFSKNKLKNCSLVYTQLESVKTSTFTDIMA